MTENNENNTAEENATATTTIREDLVSSAVNFLKDPKVQNSAIEKRLDFLKNKGLTQEEIDQALSRANVSSTSTPSAAGSTQSHTQAQPTAPQTYANTAAPVYSAYPVVQEQYSPSWKDYFITSAVAGAIGYGLYTFCSNVLGPVLNWPSEETLAEEKQRLDTQFDKAFEAIENMRSETATVLNTVQEQTNTINQTLDSLTNATQALKSQDEARNVDVDRLSEELDQIRKLVPELFEKNQQTQTQLMDEIQQEIKSLKSLISRKATAPTTSSINTAAYLAQNSQPIDSSEDVNKQAAPATNGVASSLPSWQSGASSSKAHLDTQSSPASPTTSKTSAALPSWQSAAPTSKPVNDIQNSSSAPSTPTLPSWQSAAGSSSSNQPSTSS